MKITFIVDRFPTLSETFILNQITSLLDLGHKVEIFSQYPTRDKKNHSDVFRYNLMQRIHYPIYIPIPKIKRWIKAALLIIIRANFKDILPILKSLNFFKYGKSVFNLNKLYRVIPFLGKNKFDIIHCQFGLNGNYGALLKELGIKGKLVTTFHGYDIRLGVDKGGNIYRQLFKYGDCFLAISEYNYSNLINFGADPHKIIFHPVGIELDKFPFRWNDNGVKHLSFVKILTVARLVEEKGLRYGIQAIDKLVKRNPEVRLEYQIIGGGPLEEELKKLVEKLGLSKVIHFLGPQQREEVIQMMQQAHLFLLPSIAEALPVVLMEAQVVGLPIVATSVGSVSQIVTDGQSGFLVPPRDVNALAERLEYLIEHSEKWPELGRNGRRLVEEKYDIVKLSKKLEDIYTQLLKG